ncbi:hypothetical protein DBR36_03880 [Microbacterium sp. HMWF026]|nr:hypothetical protein DBR36_03880 [Microbacterium sp. HMWF026]
MGTRLPSASAVRAMALLNWSINTAAAATMQATANGRVFSAVTFLALPEVAGSPRCDQKRDQRSAENHRHRGDSQHGSDLATAGGHSSTVRAWGGRGMRMGLVPR